MNDDWTAAGDILGNKDRAAIAALSLLRVQEHGAQVLLDMSIVGALAPSTA